MKYLVSLLLATTLLGCMAKDVPYVEGSENKTWRLKELNHTKLRQRITLTLNEDGSVSGKAPCNSYRSKHQATYPKFKLSAISSTRMMCDAIAIETTYLATLKQMTEIEVNGNKMTLRGPNGGQLDFSATRSSE